MNKQSFFEKTADGRLGGRIVLVPNPERMATINYACRAYSHLISPGEKLNPLQFAHRISEVYDTNQARAVISALSHLV